MDVDGCSVPGQLGDLRAADASDDAVAWHAPKGATVYVNDGSCGPGRVAGVFGGGGHQRDRRKAEELATQGTCGYAWRHAKAGRPSSRPQNLKPRERR
jgi:hypothetical protein